MSQYSAFGLLRGAFNGQKHWQPAWRDPQPKSHYDIIIIGGGGHGHRDRRDVGRKGNDVAAKEPGEAPRNVGVPVEQRPMNSWLTPEAVSSTLVALSASMLRIVAPVRSLALLDPA